MEKLLEILAQLLPTAKLFCLAGMEPALAETLAMVLNPLLIYLLFRMAKKCYYRVVDIKAAKELIHFRYHYSDVEEKRRMFIPTHGQNNSPTHEEEPGDSTAFIVRKKLIPFFMKTAFSKKEKHKFYLILADSGMGKTTFMINLYLKYHSFFNLRRKYKMKLFPFGDPDVLKHIQAIQPNEAMNTLLLLDAFDEYKALLPSEKPDGLTDDERFHKLLDEIIDSVKGFREVVITSRTQYFPGQEDQPYQLKIPRFGSDQFHVLAKLYLSPFEDKEINRYLDKKYGIVKFWNKKKKSRAKTLVKSSPKLMVRPMLLSYIDYLVGSSQNFGTTYQIYETLVEKWIEREAGKRKHKTVDQEEFKNGLKEFSRFAALEIYRNREKNLLLTKEQARKICSANNIKLKDYEITGQSLLTRDASQNWKFAHKSILEFFLAKEAIENFEFWLIFDVVSFDMALLFIKEKQPSFLLPLGSFVYVEGGIFKMGSNEEKKEQPIREVKVPSFCIGKTPITQKQWRDTMGSDPKELFFKGRDNNPVEGVSWDDAQLFIKKLNEKTGKTFRLPTEAEWEFAARGGIETSNALSRHKYSGSNNLDEVAWYSKNSYDLGEKHENFGTNPVAQKKPNKLGIYDMSGNVWEWCQDKWHGNYEGAPDDGSAWETGDRPERVLCGGSWDDGAGSCAVSNRILNGADFRINYIGFRLALSL